MASKKLADRKKSRRDAEKRQQALKRRETAVQERRQKSIEFKVNKMMKPKSPPVRKDISSDDSTVNKQLTADEIRARLNHNLEILKELEKEYDAEMAARQERNENLEEEGLVSLKEKMDALHGQVISHQSEEAKGIAFGGEADAVVDYK